MTGFRVSNDDSPGIERDAVSKTTRSHVERESLAEASQRMITMADRSMSSFFEGRLSA
jgi:hypothetical protein